MSQNDRLLFLPLNGRLVILVLNVKYNCIICVSLFSDHANMKNSLR